MHVPTRHQLQRFYFYAPLVRAIRAQAASLSYSGGTVFRFILVGHSASIGNNPYSPSDHVLLPRLTHLELSIRDDPLLPFVHLLLHAEFRKLVLPHYVDGRLVSSRLQVASASLESLVIVVEPRHMHNFMRSVHQFTRLRDITIPLLEPGIIHVIAGLPCITNLTIVTNDSSDIDTDQQDIVPFSGVISSLKVIIERSIFPHAAGALHCARVLLETLRLRFQQLSITIPRHCGGDALSHFLEHHRIIDPSFDIRRLSINVSDPQWPAGALAPLSFTVLHGLISMNLTHVEFKDFSMCDMDDQDLHTLSSAMPNIETLILGTGRYWTSPPRASLKGVTFVLEHCRALKELGIVFNCSLGGINLMILPVNRSIRTLQVGISPPYHPNTVALFFSRSLPNLITIEVEPWLEQAMGRRDDIKLDRFERMRGWDKVLDWMS